MHFSWRRPNSDKFPVTWHTFKAKDLNSEQLVNYYVKDLTEDQFDAAIEFLTPNMLTGVPFYVALDVFNDEETKQELIVLWRKVLSQKLSTVCCNENSNEIIGINLLGIVNNEISRNLSSHFKTSKSLLIQETKKFINSKINYNKLENIEKYLTAFGMSVAAKYRGRGIGTEILKSRISIARNFGIKVIATQFAAPDAQKMGIKAGYNLDYSISVKELADSGFYFPLEKTRTVNLMSLVIDDDK